MSSQQSHNTGESTPDPPGDALIIDDACWIPAEAIDVSFSRSSGPGGQAVNKVNTRVQLRVQVEAIVGLTDSTANRLRRLAGQRLTVDDQVLIQCDSHRSQLSNRRECETRLIDLITRARKVPKRRKRTRPSRAMIERRLNQKKQQAEKKRRRQRDKNPRDDW